MTEVDDHFPALLSSTLVKTPKNVQNPKKPNSSAAMNVPSLIPVSSGLAETGGHSVKLLDYLKAASFSVVPTPAGGSLPGLGKAPTVDMIKELPPPTLPQSSPSWKAKMMEDQQGQGRLKLEFIPPCIEDDVIVVSPPIEVEEQGIDRWRNCLVGHFLDKKLPYRAVRSIVMRIWKRFGIKDVMANEHGFFFFLFEHDGALSKVLEAGPWLIGGKLLVLRRWQPHMAFVKEQLEKIPIWVQFYNVPFEYWTARGLSHIASSVGVPLYADEPTEKCERLNFGRICVEVNLDSSFPDSFELRFPNGDSVEVGIQYPWHPLKCMRCRVFGHSDG